MESMGLKFTPVVVTRLLLSEHVCAYGQDFLGSQLVQAVLTEGSVNLRLTAHQSSPTTHLTHSPLVHATNDITVVVKKFLKIQQCQLASTNSYITLTKRLFQLYIYLVWLQSSTRKSQWFQYFKLELLEIPNMTIQSVFENQFTNIKTIMFTTRKCNI